MTTKIVSMKDHWERVYHSNEINKLGWYEEVPERSLQLITGCGIRKEDVVLDVGSGASTLIESLLAQGYQKIIAADISAQALKKSRNRLSKHQASLVKWIVDDITKPVHLSAITNVSLWHDRAVLHFLLEERQRKAYLNTLNNVVKKEGYVIIAAFSLKGAKKCSGLDIHRYDAVSLAVFLGNCFELKTYFDYTYYMPSGEPRPYIYTLFQKVE